MFAKRGLNWYQQTVTILLSGGSSLLCFLLNLSYFLVEFFFAFAAKSVSLVADSIDFLEDSALNLLVLLSLGANALV